MEIENETEYKWVKEKEIERESANNNNNFLRIERDDYLNTLQQFFYGKIYKVSYISVLLQYRKQTSKYKNLIQTAHFAGNAGFQSGIK